VHAACRQAVAALPPWHAGALQTLLVFAGVDWILEMAGIQAPANVRVFVWRALRLQHPNRQVASR